MLQLAIECSGLGGSIALMDGPESLAERVLPSHLSTVQSLAPEIQQLLESVRQFKPEFLSVTTGPGSFTGLRVGIATAKMLGLAWNIPICPVNSLHVIARRASKAIAASGGADPYAIVSVMNAFRKQVFVAAWGATQQPIIPTQVMDASIWCDNPRLVPDASQEFREESRFLYVAGPGLNSYPLSESLMENLGLACVPPTHWDPDAREVGELGWTMFQRGEVNVARELEANYVRASAAEEKAAGKHDE